MDSKALEAKRFIYDLLRNDSTLGAEKFDVSWSWPAGGPPGRWVMVGRIQWQDTEWATNRSRTERFTVSVLFNVMLLAANAEEAETYVRDMARAFETALSADPGMGGLLISSTVRPGALDSQPMPEGFEAQFELEVECQARP